MYLVRYLSRSIEAAVTTVALASPKDVFNLVTVLDDSSKIIGWQVVEYPNLYHSFGWANEGWNKHRPNGFTREDYLC
jgi:hypothetical protein